MDKIQKDNIKFKVHKMRRLLRLHYDKNNMNASIAHCLTDLMHFCAAQPDDVGFHQLHERAALLFQQERK